MAEKEEPKNRSAISSFIGGTLAGWSKVFVGQPFDIVKVRLANASGSNSALDVLTGIVKQEGFLTLWRGSLPPFVGIGACTSILFGSYSNFKQRFSSDPTQRLADWQYLAAGAGASLCQAVLLTPTEGLRIRRQVQGRIDPRGDPLYKNDLDCVTTVFKNHGIRGWYKGGVISVSRDVVGFSSYFWFYEKLTYALMPVGGSIKDLSPFTLFVCGGTAGVFFWIVCYPLDVLRSRIQGDSLSNPRYAGIADCAKQIYAADGVKGFTKGFLPCFLRAFPVNASMWFCFEMYGRLAK